MRRFVFAMALAPALALADAPPHVYIPPTLPGGRPHTCPPLPLHEGAVGFAYTITPDGATKDAVITQPSGDPAIDDHALACVAGWRYTTLPMLDGKPVSAPWSGGMLFSVDGSNPTPRPGHPVPAMALGATCLIDDYPAEARKACVQGIATMSYTVRPDGSVSDMAVAQSSGDARLDAASLRCASKWRYKPEAGPQESFHWQAKAVWALNPDIRTPKP